MLKKILTTILLSLLVISFNTGCDDINEDSSLLDIAYSIQKVVKELNDEVLNEVFKEGIEEFKNGKTLYHEDEDGAIVGQGVVKVYPFKKNNIQVDGTITYTDFQPDPESPVINATMDCHLGAFYNPIISGLLFLGFPIVTDFTIHGPIELSGRINTTIDVDIEYNGLIEPKLYRAVINGVDYAEILKEEIAKAEQQKKLN